MDFLNNPHATETEKFEWAQATHGYQYAAKHKRKLADRVRKRAARKECE